MLLLLLARSLVTWARVGAVSAPGGSECLGLGERTSNPRACTWRFTAAVSVLHLCFNICGILCNKGIRERHF